VLLLIRHRDIIVNNISGSSFSLIRHRDVIANDISGPLFILIRHHDVTVMDGSRPSFIVVRHRDVTIALSGKRPLPGYDTAMRLSPPGAGETADPMYGDLLPSPPKRLKPPTAGVLGPRPMISSQAPTALAQSVVMVTWICLCLFLKLRRSAPKLAFHLSILLCCSAVLGIMWRRCCRAPKRTFFCVVYAFCCEHAWARLFTPHVVSVLSTG